MLIVFEKKIFIWKRGVLLRVTLKALPSPSSSIDLYLPNLILQVKRKNERVLYVYKSIISWIFYGVLCKIVLNVCLWTVLFVVFQHERKIVDTVISRITPTFSVKAISKALLFYPKVTKIVWKVLLGSDGARPSSHALFSNQPIQDKWRIHVYTIYGYRNIYCLIMLW